MTTNPFYNAVLALAYIAILVIFLFFAPHALGLAGQSVLYPMAALALFVLSAALMAYLFFYQPVVMILDGHRERGMRLFLQTVGIFAIGTVILLVIIVVMNG